MIIDDFFKKVLNHLDMVIKSEKENMKKAAEVIKEALKNDKLIHVYGSGHSQILAQEVFYRAGGLVPINAMLDLGSSVYSGATKSTGVERLEGYAKILVDYYDVKEGDVIIIVSNSGRNAVPIEMALESKKRGATVIALTAVEYSKSHRSRHSSGKRLFEVADIVLDNKVPSGDAVLEIEGVKTRVAPISTIINATILHAVLSQAVKYLVEEGVEPPVWMSANVEGGDKFNRKYIEKYKKLIKHL